MKAMDAELSLKRKISVLRGIVDSFYADVDSPIIFDKSRGWIAHFEMLNSVLEYPTKVLVPVRDLRDVLASFEKLHRKKSALGQTKEEALNYVGFQTVEQRCDTWVKANEPIGLAYNRIKDALQRGWQSSMFFVDYDKFCKNPERMMKNIYEFLGEEYYQHNFKNVEQVTWEDDSVHGVPLHGIRNEIKPQPPQYPSILGSVADKYKGQEVW